MMELSSLVIFIAVIVVNCHVYYVLVIVFFSGVLSSKTIREIKKNNKFMFLNDKAIEAWHAKFVKLS